MIKKIEILSNIKKELMFLGICKPQPSFLTVKEIREIMINGEDMPTAIFSASKKDYIVKPRTIFGPKVKIKKKGCK